MPGLKFQIGIINSLNYITQFNKDTRNFAAFPAVGMMLECRGIIIPKEWLLKIAEQNTSPNRCFWIKSHWIK